MKELKVLGKDGYRYILIDKDNKKYDLNIEIVDTDYNIMIGDIMYISTEIVDRERIFTFGKINSDYGVNMEDINDQEIVVFSRDNVKYYFKRIYG